MGLLLGLRGSVQGVGFRPWVQRTARELRVRGRVANAPDGVRVEAFGTDEALERFRARLAAPSLPGASVESIACEPLEACPEPVGFEIAASRVGSGSHAADVALAPDLPVCPACLEELSDPSSRRHRYPFVACAGCGPRYTMARELPWDRERTAMADFPLCPACAAEYSDPDDRRYHAEASACPACGPSLRGLDAHGDLEASGGEALVLALETLREGGIVAVQGIGGFHLACDAVSETAVRRLRARKRRPRRPLAVMVAGLAEAEKHALVGPDERELLCSEARPIVLLRRRSDSSLAPSLAPDSDRVGLLLAYTPLHVLLLEAFGAPLVMTSANRSGEPIVHRPERAARDLSGVCDRVLANDREIVSPCDDSVAIAAESGPVWLRRSRGWVPRPVRLARPVREPVLALGGHWSNTVCVAAGRQAWPSAHVGDVESPECVARLEETVERWLAWLDVSPRWIAHDLHPAYESTRLARSFGCERTIGVQHHHAHVAAVLGEHGVRGPAFGLAWDGTGAGLDGTAWGGELLFGDLSAVRRLASFRPIALAGGDRAIREPWRLALALLQDAFDGEAPLDAFALFELVDDGQREAVAALLARPGLCAPAHGVGRYFDAVAALLLRRPLATWSGELAQALNFAATGRAASAWPFVLDTGSSPWQIDLRPAVRALVDEMLAGTPAPLVADRFHATLAAAGEAAVREALRVVPEASEVPGGRARVALAGGCFANPILLGALERGLGRDLEVLRPRRLPPGDGGLAFGQALVADAVVRARSSGDGAPGRGEG